MGVPFSTCRSVVAAEKNRPCAEQIAQQKQAVTDDICQHMMQQGELVTTILDKMLMRLNDDERLDAATLPQITTAMGTLLDKFLMIRENAAKTDGSAGGVIMMPALDEIGGVDDE